LAYLLSLQQAHILHLEDSTYFGKARKARSALLSPSKQLLKGQPISDFINPRPHTCTRHSSTTDTINQDAQ
jgi:hypothetical protein